MTIMNSLRIYSFSVISVMVIAVSAQAEPKVVTSIKPVHSLVSAVMKGVDVPALIVEGADSPHTYALKPSQAKMLEQADLVFWIGHDLETFLEKPIKNIATKATVIKLFDTHGLNKLTFRKDAAFEKHEHGAKHENKYDHDKFDPHIWLDPQNVRVLINKIKQAFIEIDVANAVTYEANVSDLDHKLDELIEEIDTILQPVKGRAFIVLHDAYHYFENRFGIKAVGSVTISSGITPGAQHVSKIQMKIKEMGVTCVFTEPQFKSKLVSVIVKDTQTKAAYIDPLGVTLKEGAGLYFSLIRNMAYSIRDCLL